MPYIFPHERENTMATEHDGRPPMAEEIPTSHHEEDPSGEDSGSEAQDQPFSPRRGHTFKRPGDPPRHPDGKIMCNFDPKCHLLRFERKCEWSKHMDKHDRPYKCREPGCEKLLGFTYSGGLLRHQREVHKMHGGTKEALFCPVKECKRSSGPGFTRKENLNEHMRRVHRRASGSSEPTVRKEGPEVEAEQSEAPSTDAPTPGEFRTVNNLSATVKRKRAFPTAEQGIDTDEASSEVEIKRLRLETESKDERIRQLEDENAKFKARLDYLEDLMASRPH